MTEKWIGWCPSKWNNLYLASISFLLRCFLLDSAHTPHCRNNFGDCSLARTSCQLTWKWALVLKGKIWVSISPPDTSLWKHPKLPGQQLRCSELASWHKDLTAFTTCKGWIGRNVRAILPMFAPTFHRHFQSMSCSSELSMAWGVSSLEGQSAASYSTDQTQALACSGMRMTALQRTKGQGTTYKSTRSDTTLTHKPRLPLKWILTLQWSFMF